MNTELVASEKSRYLRAFVASFLLGIATRLLSAYLDSFSGMHPPGWLVVVGLAIGVGAIAAGVWLIYRTFRFARALDYGTAGAVGFAVMSGVPLLNLVAVLILVRGARRAA